MQTCSIIVRFLHLEHDFFPSIRFLSSSFSSFFILFLPSSSYSSLLLSFVSSFLSVSFLSFNEYTSEFIRSTIFYLLLPFKAKFKNVPKNSFPHFVPFLILFLSSFYFFLHSVSFFILFLSNFSPCHSYPYLYEIASQVNPIFFKKMKKFFFILILPFLISKK